MPDQQLIQTLAAMPGAQVGTSTAEDRKLRNRVAEALILKGIDTSPVAHWTQGAARVAQALFGGMAQGRLTQEAEDEQKGYSAAVLNDPLLGGATAPAAAPGAPVASLESGGGVPAAVADGNVPASIRYNNPGAQYPGPSATAYGSTGHGVIGGGHKIAAFNSPEEGAAAQFDLLRRGYSGMPLAAAINKWSGGNSAPQYVAGIAKATGLDPSTVITPQLLQSPQGVALAQAMARHEAGRDFPLTPEQWQAAQGRVFGGGAPLAEAAAPSPQANITQARIAGVEAPETAELPPGATPAQYVAPQPGGGVAPLTPPAAGRPTAIDPQRAAYIRGLLQSGNPKIVAYGQQLLNAERTRLTKTPSWEKLDDETLYRKDTAETRSVARPTTGDSVIPPAPPGVNRKIWEKEWSERQVKDALPGSDEGAGKLRAEIRALPTYKAMAEVAPRYSSMVAAAGRDNRAADLSLVYGLMKILDPTSVVRESEAAMAQNIATIPENFRAQVQSFLTGTGRLAPEVREGMMMEARGAAESYKQQFERDIDQYKGIAKRGRFIEADIVPQFGDLPTFTPPPKVVPPTQKTKTGVEWSR